MKNDKVIKIVIIVIFCILTTANIYAKVPQIVEYKAYLTDTSGIPLNSKSSILFRLYDSNTAGSGNVVWQEDHPNVGIDKGIVNIYLGAKSSFSSLSFDREYFLEIIINGEVLSPRQKFAYSAYAIRAGNVAVAEFARQADRAAVADTVTDPDFLVPTGAIILCKNSCPAGYRRVSELDGKFLTGGTHFTASAGGSNPKTLAVNDLPSHTHDVSHQHNVLERDSSGSYTDSDAVSYNKPLSSRGLEDFIFGYSGNTGATGGSQPIDIRPAFATVILCEKQ